METGAGGVATGDVRPAHGEGVEVELLEDPARVLLDRCLSSKTSEEVGLHVLLAGVEVVHALALGGKELRHSSALEQVGLSMLIHILATAHNGSIDHCGDHEGMPFQVGHATRRRVHAAERRRGQGGRRKRLLRHLVRLHLLLLASTPSIGLPGIVELGNHLEETVDGANFSDLREALDEVPPPLHQLLPVSRVRRVLPHPHAEQIHACPEWIHPLRECVHASISLPSEPPGLHGLVELGFLQPVSARSSVCLHAGGKTL
mmetsp:Transcript_1964/g.5905  ORF Transcript_1964/g.5905 Transcript_1964/m.5905 type:complete len:260 (+) Transcript_1964:2504-3283(+)